MMRAEILSVGTELLLGHITDTNATYLSQQLAMLGIDLYFVSQVGDNLQRLSETLARARARAELVVMTGGLGPTEDDLSREAIAAVLDETPHVDPALEAELRAFFASRGIAMPERNVKQAWVLPSATPLPNPLGTAPGWWAERDGKVIVAMPGVPHEMMRMWDPELAPRLRPRTGASSSPASCASQAWANQVSRNGSTPSSMARIQRWLPMPSAMPWTCALPPRPRRRARRWRWWRRWRRRRG